MSGKSDQVLLNYTRESYGDSFQADLLDQYKLFVQSAESVSARRIASTRYLLTLNAAIVGLYGFQSSGISSNWWTILLPIMGIAFSILWHRIIKSHQELNTIKFDIILELE